MGRLSQNQKLKTIKIRGKDYVMVHQRILAFNEQFPNGKITTKILQSLDNGGVLVQAKVYPDASDELRFFVGHSASNPKKLVEKENPIEVAETSAVGRALAMMGIGILDGIASAEEVSVANRPSLNRTMQKSEKQRVVDWINEAKDLKTLQKAKKMMKKYPDISKIYETKEKKLKEKEKIGTVEISDKETEKLAKLIN